MCAAYLTLSMLFFGVYVIHIHIWINRCVDIYIYIYIYIYIDRYKKERNLIYFRICNVFKTGVNTLVIGTCKVQFCLL